MPLREGLAESKADGNPLLWLSFNEASGTGVWDASGRGRHGHLTASRDREEGIVAKSLRFGPGTSLSVPLKAGILQRGGESGSFTLSVWVKADPQTGVDRLLVGKAGFHSGLLAHFEKDAMRFGFTLWNANRKGFAVRTGPIERPDEWHHLAATYEAGSFRLYLDGRFVSKGTFEGEFRDANDVWTIGGTPQNEFVGRLDELKIHGGALAPEEVLELFLDRKEAAVFPVPGEGPWPESRLEPDRPILSSPLFTNKPVIAHYMTQMNTVGDNRPWFMNPDIARPDGPASNVGGVFPYRSFFAEHLTNRGDLDAIEFEIRAAKKMGVDGFHFYYQSPAPGSTGWVANNRMIRRFFEVLDRTGIDFKLTLCISHPNQPLPAREKIKACALAIRDLLDDTRSSPHWLRAPDGRIVFFTWATEGFSDGVLGYADLIRKPDVDAEVRKLAEGYESLASLIGEPSAFVFHAKSLNSFEIAMKGVPNGALDVEKAFLRYREAVLAYFPAVVGFADYPVNERTTAEWAGWSRIGHAKKRAVGQAVMNDYVKTYHRNGQLPKASDLPALRLFDLRSYYLPVVGAQPFRTYWQRAIDQNAEFISYVTWNDYPEGHHLAPESHHNFAFAFLSDWYRGIWRGETPRTLKDGAAVFFHKYAIDRVPSLFPMKSQVVPWHVGKDPDDIRRMDVIDVVALLTEDGSVRINGHATFAGRKGMNVFQIPMEPGPVTVEAGRGDVFRTLLRTPEWVTDHPYRTDRLLYGWSSECEARTVDLFGPGRVAFESEYAEEGGVPAWKRKGLAPPPFDPRTIPGKVPRVDDDSRNLENVDETRFSVLLARTNGEGATFVGKRGERPWSGPKDLGAVLSGFCDSTHLWLRLDVVDDRQVDPPEDPAQCWKADSVQIAVASPDANLPLEFGISLRGGIPRFALFQGNASLPSFETTAVSTNGLARYQARIPLSIFGARRGSTLGISAVVNDADEVQRRQFLELGEGIGASKNPDLYPLYVLGDGK